MTGHHLGHTVRTMSAYTARCQCGLDIWGHLAWVVWERHTDHLGHVRAQSLRRNPSRKRDDQ